MYKSVVGSYDTFAENRLIDVSTDDGEEIIALASYADRVLQFKTNTLYIINTAQGTEYLEDTRSNMGVAHPYAVVKTEYGIAWANTHGCYLYNGDSIVVLTEKDNFRKIRIDTYISTPTEVKVPTWASALSELGISGNMALYYVPGVKKLVVVDKHGDSGNGAGFVCDLATGAWSYHKNSLVVAGRVTNAVIAGDKKMAYLSQATVDTSSAFLYTWSATDVTYATGDFELITKNYDFGDSARRTTVYEVRVDFKKGENITVYLSTDGGDTKTEIGALTTSSSRTTVSLTTSLPMIDIYTCMLIFRSTGATQVGLEIYGIDVVYRMKHLKNT